MLEYKIKLCNVWWNENDIDTRFFEDTNSQILYFNSLPGTYSNLVNFNMGDNISSTIYYTDTSSLSIEELVASNYAIVKRIQNDNGNIQESYRYYFARCSQSSGRQLRVEINLDDIQTNFIKYKNDLSPCMIRRACLNRFENDENEGYVRFKGDSNSPLFESENLSLNKRLVNRYKVVNKSDTNSSSDVDEWINDNVLAWNYLLIQGNKTYNTKGWGLETLHATLPNINYTKSEEDITGMVGTGAILYAPIMKGNAKIYIIDESEWSGYPNPAHPVQLNADYGFLGFRGNNNDSSFYYANKLTLKNLLDVQDYEEGVNYYISGSNLYIKGKVIFTDSPTMSGNYCLYLYNPYSEDPLHPFEGYGVMYMHDDRANRMCEEIELPYEFSFDKSEIIGASKNKKYNPKLLGNDYLEIVVNNGNGNNYTYDLQKMNDNTIQLKYTEVLTGDVSKGYTRLASGSGLYTQDTSSNFTGLVSTNDTSIPYDNGQLALFFANNKNFFLQSNVNLAVGAIENIGNSTIQGATNGGGIGAAAGAVSGVLKSGIDVGVNLFNRSMTIDNLRNKPNELKQANGNAIFTSMITDMSIYLEVYKGLDYELESVNDYMFMYGFKYNKIDNINSFINIRKYFNYIEADLNVINAPISIEEKTRLIEKFKSIRFWNTDTIQYSLENYERWLEE